MYGLLHVLLEWEQFIYKFQFGSLSYKVGEELLSIFEVRPIEDEIDD